MEVELDEMFDDGKQHSAKYKQLEAKFIKMQRDDQLDDLPLDGMDDDYFKLK